MLDFSGKGAKDRAVPISDRLADALVDWRFPVGPKVRVIRSLGRNKVTGDSISTIGLDTIVQNLVKMIVKPDLQSRDLRRTAAEPGRRAGVSIEQISSLL